MHLEVREIWYFFHPLVSWFMLSEINSNNSIFLSVKFIRISPLLSSSSKQALFLAWMSKSLYNWSHSDSPIVHCPHSSKRNKQSKTNIKTNPQKPQEIKLWSSFLKLPHGSPPNSNSNSLPWLTRSYLSWPLPLWFTYKEFFLIFWILINVLYCGPHRWCWW